MQIDIQYIKLVLIHVGIGLMMYFISPFSRLFFLAMVVFFLIRIVMAQPSRKTFEVLKACAYISGVEVLLRMTDGAIFYESSKYLVILFVLIGIFYKGISSKAYPYFFYLIALVPAIIVASTNIGFDVNFRTNIAFVLSGPVALGVTALYCYDKKITLKQIVDIILYMGLPIIAMTTYLFLYSPSLKDVLSGTQSNFAASGGFGPNQVATILGFGMFAFTARVFLKSPGLLLKVFNALIFSAIAYRAVITFSRGGVIGAIIIIVAFLIVLYFRSNNKQRSNIITSFALFLAALSITWTISSNQSEGLIDKRYANQDATGREKADLSTGRVDLFVNELDGFIDNPFFGVGASVMKEIRTETLGTGIVSHNELSRLLSEHGLFGILILLILIIKPLMYRVNNKKNFFFYAFLFFWFATINHSAMRIAAPAFIYGLSLLNITYEKHPIYRKQIKQQAL
jgi:O-Antigen ligase